MEKTYNPASIEVNWYQRWEEQGHFVPRGSGESYCIMIPPPNVTGTLHMGHAFQDTLMDALSRYHRMLGRNTLWQPGTDHAGIATQMVVERQLGAEDKTRHDLGRDKFIERVWEWKAESGNTITSQLRRMGASVDWSRERFTMDEGLSEAVREVFVRLYEEGLIYRGKRLVNWDPVLHTALSDLEVDSREENGHLWHMRYPIADGSGHLVVATTRPETMLGDSAVAVHPDDERYRQLVGKQVKLPLSGRTIPVIADDYVDPEFGSGCVKITPAHDFNDYAMWERHREELINLPGRGLINIFTSEAKILSPVSAINNAVGQRTSLDSGGKMAIEDKDDISEIFVDKIIPKKYQNLDRFKARKQIISDLEAQGLLEMTEDHKLMIPRGDRSNVILEPFLTDQWYVSIEALAKPAIKAVEDGRIKFVPENWNKTYFEWMRNIQDWCISRQLWWGHRIPAWYDKHGKPYVGRTFEEARSNAQADGSDIREEDQDQDVLDTWFSSALWPFSTLGWPEQTNSLKTFYPTSVLVTGFDIIFFWVARMIMMGLHFMDDVPFHEIYITGLIRDEQGQKMSKSKGNVLDPIDLIDGIALDDLVSKRTSGLMQPQMAKKIETATRKHFPDGIPSFGTDALRFTFAALASTGRDIKFDLKRIEGYRNFCNKIWNATRYVLMNTEGHTSDNTNVEPEYSLPDKWILDRLQTVKRETRRHLDSYRFDLAAKTLYDFTWHDYCDWYLELSKPVLTGDQVTEAAQLAARQTLVQVLEELLRLLHPIMPFITEELWQQVATLAGITAESIQLQPYPAEDIAHVDADAVKSLEWVKAFIMGVRQIRSEMDISPGKPLPVLLQNWGAHEQRLFDDNSTIIISLAKLEGVTWLKDEAAPESATSLVGEMKLLIPLAGLIDKKAELARLEKKLGSLRVNIGKCNAKLENTSFTERAPAAVVQQERDRVHEMEISLSQLEEQADRIRAL